MTRFHTTKKNLSMYPVLAHPSSASHGGFTANLHNLYLSPCANYFSIAVLGTDIATKHTASGVSTHSCPERLRHYGRHSLQVGRSGVHRCRVRAPYSKFGSFPDSALRANTYWVGLAGLNETEMDISFADIAGTGATTARTW